MIVLTTPLVTRDSSGVVLFLMGSVGRCRRGSTRPGPDVGALPGSHGARGRMKTAALDDTGTGRALIWFDCRFTRGVRVLERAQDAPCRCAHAPCRCGPD